MQPAPTPTPSRIVGDLLAAHPEAASLLAEASHREALATHSVATASQAFTVAQAARLRHEELRHLLDPRRCRSIHFGAGLVLLAGIVAGLAMLDGIELSGMLGEPLATRATIAATAVWLTGAWLAALASRERRRALVAALTAAAVALGLLLAALYGVAAPSSRPTAWSHVGTGAFTSVLIVVLAAGAAVLIGRLEPASVLLARHRWQRLSAEHDAAVKHGRADAEAASVAREAWLGLVRTHATTVAGESGEPLVKDTLQFASALHEPGWPRLSPLLAGSDTREPRAPT